MKIITFSILLLGICTSCVRHIYPYSHKQRRYQNAQYAEKDAAKTPGSLWSEAAFNLFENSRAHRVGDILTIRVKEQDSASRGTSTALQRKSDFQSGVGAFWTAINKLVQDNPGIDPKALLALNQSSDFSGIGNTQRSGQLQAILPVRIKSTLPNNDFFVEGTKALLLNEEESFLYISGVVRPIDIEPDNSVSSSVLADVELEYTGRGSVTENEHPGWLQRVLTYLWPF